MVHMDDDVNDPLLLCMQQHKLDDFNSNHTARRMENDVDDDNNDRNSEWASQNEFDESFQAG
jgi:hypothetical protein